RFSMRRMSSTGKDRHFYRAIAFLLRDLDLADRPILVVGALDDGDGDADIGEVVRDVPGAEFWIEPGAAPTIKGVVDILVPARELLAQIGGLKGGRGLGDRLQSHVFDDEMRRDQHDAIDAMILDAAGIDSRDRSAVGMA